MPNPATPREIYLQPGDHHFGSAGTRIRTLLGSCVSLVFWHPRRHLGGMCHFMLPTRQVGGAKLDGRYGDEAMQLLLNAITASGTRAQDYQLRVFGGGNMFPNLRPKSHRHIGQQNIDMAKQLMAQHGLVSHGEHVGGTGHRHIIFDIYSGQLALKLSNPVTSTGRLPGARPQ